MIEAASLANMNQSSVTKPTLCPTDPMADKYPNEVAAFAKPKPTMVAAASFLRCSSIIPPHMEHAYCSASTEVFRTSLRTLLFSMTHLSGFLQISPIVGEDFVER